jgi:hypothetical protein
MGTLTIHYMKYTRFLKALRQEWDRGRAWRHTQATGFLLGAFVRDPVAAAHKYLPLTLKFIERNGPYGVDGILLSAMSAAKILAPDNFEMAVNVCELLEGSIDQTPKEGLGIYFVDFEMGLKGLLKGEQLGIGKDIGAGVEQGRGKGWDDLISGKGMDLLTSSFPDKYRVDLFNGDIFRKQRAD